MRGHTLALQLSTMMKQFVPLGKAVGVAVESEKRSRRKTEKGDRCRRRENEKQKRTRMVRKRERGERWIFSELNFYKLSCIHASASILSLPSY